MTKRKRKPAKAPHKPELAEQAKPSTKQHQMVQMLQRPEGATIDQMVKALGWQSHTVRGTMSGALKKRLGLKLTSTKDEGGRIYRIA